MIEVLGTKAEMEQGSAAEDAKQLEEAREVLGPEAAAWDLLSCRVAARCRVAIVEGAEGKTTWGGARYASATTAGMRLYVDNPYADEKAKRAAWAERVAQLRAVADAEPLQGGWAQ